MNVTGTFTDAWMVLVALRGTPIWGNCGNCVLREEVPLHAATKWAVETLHKGIAQQNSAGCMSRRVKSVMKGRLDFAQRPILLKSRKLFVDDESDSLSLTRSLASICLTSKSLNGLSLGNLVLLKMPGTSNLKNLPPIGGFSWWFTMIESVIIPLKPIQGSAIPYIPQMLHDLHVWNIYLLRFP